jgi:phytoene dehydrogenase-like protein
VAVLEQAPAAGGAVRSQELTLPGFVHDTHAGFFPLAAVSPALSRLPLAEHGLEWISPPVAMAHPFEDGSAIALHRDLGATAASLDASAAGAGSTWAALVDRIWPHREALVRTALSPLPPLLPAARLALGLRGEALQLARQMLGPATELGRELFGAPRPTAWLCGSVAHGDLAASAPGTAVLGFGLAFLAHLAGWPIPRGGAGRITDALVSLLQARGGAVRCSATVEQLELSGGRVRAVRLRGGERLAADAVVATTGPAPLLAMLPPGALGARVTRALSRWRYGLGTLKLDLALSAPAPWVSPLAGVAGVVPVGGVLAEPPPASDEARRGMMPLAPALIVGQQSLHDPARAPAGRHTLYAYTRIPTEPGLGEAEMAEIVERRLEQFAPGLSELVLARSVRGPARQAQENPALVGGDLAAGSVALDQLLLFRPAPELCRYRTPAAGLYVAGGSVHPGPGVHGVSGAGAARALLADRRPPRRALRAGLARARSRHAR